MREFAESVVTLFNLLPREFLEAFGAKSFPGERTHHATVKHGALENIACKLTARCNVAHKASREGVTRARGVDNGLQRQSWRPKRMAADPECIFAEEDGGAVLAV